jgi:DnaA N-terminal domain
MAILAQKQEQEAPNNKDQLGKLYSFKKEKARYRKSYIDWDKIKRANRGNFFREKAKHLSDAAKAILAPVIQKLEKGERVFLNHKYISTLTFCKRGQNCNIIKQLESVLDITYYNSITHEGKKHRHSYEFSYYKENSTAQFIKRNESLNPSYQAISDMSIENNNTESIRSNVRAHESTFLQNLQGVRTEENITPKIVQFSEESVKPAKLKKRLANERKKPTNSERKARVYHFKQYKEPQDLKHHYPLTKEDAGKLQSLSGRDFSLNAMNEILLDMSKRLDNRFCSKAQFMAYFSKCLRFEKRDAIKTGNDNFYIKANVTPITQRKIDKENQIEQYLAEVEQIAITHVCPENQLKARIANVLEPLRAYALLSNIKDFAVIGSIARIYLRTDFQLSRYETNLVLSQFKSIYSGLEVDIESVEYLVENVCKQVNSYDEVQTKSTPVMPTLQQGIWGDICRKLITIYGVHIYNNWFSKLTPVIDEQAKTIELKAPNSFIQEEITKRYGDVIIELSKNLDLKFIGIIRTIF